jgi:hypothetical protein
LDKLPNATEEFQHKQGWSNSKAEDTNHAGKTLAFCQWQILVDEECFQHWFLFWLKLSTTFLVLKTAAGNRSVIVCLECEMFVFVLPTTLISKRQMARSHFNFVTVMSTVKSQCPSWVALSAHL